MTEQVCPHGAAVDPDGWSPCEVCGGPAAPWEPPAELSRNGHRAVALLSDVDTIRAIELEQPAPSAVRLPNLPAEIWTERPALAHIRKAARSRMRSADVALLAVLARLASMLAPCLRADAGLGPAQLCTFLAVVGPSGAGKTTGYRVAADLLPAPPHLDGVSTDGVVPYIDGIGIGSGEGLAELYMGRGRDDEGSLTRKQVRHRALVVVDEGETLTALGQRRGATAGAVLRAAWSGAALGSAGASSETTRVIRAGEYTLGMVTGWQMGTAQALIADTDTGMAQRFLWCSATDPTINEHDVPDWPGVLDIKWTDEICAQNTVTYPEAVRDELRARHAAIQRGEIAIDPMDTHAPLHRIRLAALLAVLDGRIRVTAEDWELGGVIWQTSQAVRAAVAEHGRREAERERDKRDEQRVTLAERTAAVVDVAPVRVQQIARRLAERVRDAGGMTRADARRGVKYQERHLYNAAVTVADVHGWVTVGQSGALLPGEIT